MDREEVMEIKDWNLAKVEYRYLLMKVSAIFCISLLLIFRICKLTLFNSDTVVFVLTVGELVALLITLITLIYSAKFSHKMRKTDIDNSTYNDEYLNHIHHQAFKKVTRYTAAFCLILYMLVRDYFPEIITLESGILLVLLVMTMTYTVSISYYLFIEK